MNTKRGTKKMGTNGDYKEEIIATRVGGLGSSDAGMVARIGRTGTVNYAAKERLAQMEGLIEKRQFSTPAMRLGDNIENAIFGIIKTKIDSRAVSNPLFVNEELTERFGFRIQDHIDFEVETDDGVKWYECKASKKDTWEVMKEYGDQLRWHCMNLEKRAGGKASGLWLVHYNTDGVGENDDFDSERVTITPFVNHHGTDAIIRGLEIIKETLSDNFTFIPREEICAADLPEDLQRKMDEVCARVRAAMEAERMLDEFKARMLKIMQDGNVKRISNNFFRLALVAESVSVGFDKDKFKRDNPDLYEKYNMKKTTRKAYVTLKAADNDNNNKQLTEK